MPEPTINPSPDGGATPTPSGTPATGNPASTGATPPKTPTTLEEALAELAELRRHATNKEEQASRHGTALTEAQKKLAAYEEKERKAQEATLSETQKLAKQKEDLEQKYQQEHKAHVGALVKLAASAKGIIDPDLAALAIADGLEYDDHGMPTNLDKLLEDLVKNKPYLAAKPAEPQQTQQRPPHISPNNPARSQITLPGSATLPRSQWPRLGDVLK